MNDLTSDTKMYAISPCDGNSITKGRRYEITRKLIENDGKVAFYIKNDGGINSYCLEKECGWIDGKDWKIVPEATVDKEIARLRGKMADLGREISVLENERIGV